MRCYISVICVLSALIAISHAAPMPQSGQSDQAQTSMRIVNTFNEKISLLRQYCPQIFQVIDNVIQNVTSTAFRVIGRVLLQQGGLGGSGGGGSEGGAGRVSVVLPDFGDDDDDDEDEDDEKAAATSSVGSSVSSTNGDSTPALIALEASSSVSTSGTSSTTTDSSVSIRDQNRVFSTSSTVPAITTTTTTEAVVVVDDRRNDIDSDRDDKDDVEKTITDARDRTNALSLTTSTVVPVIKEKAVEQATPDTPFATLFTSPASNVALVDVNDIRVRARRAADTDDQTAAASGGNSVTADVAAPPNPADDLANVEDDADRDKRFLPFGGSVNGIASVGSGGGSGNFLFDIIRRTADGAARAAGTVFRLIAGTETEATAIDTGGGDTIGGGGGGIGFSASHTYPRYLAPQLISGSGATETSDEQDHAPIGAGGVAEIDVAKATDAYTEGVPGPITRLFVLANRGLANLVQDLILRLAQTSERIVNFKARLVTALI